MKPITYPLANPAATGDCEPLPVTRLRRCRAQWAGARCEAEFLQSAVNADGAYATAEAQPELVQWVPDFCVKCARMLSRSEARTR